MLPILLILLSATAAIQQVPHYLRGHAKRDCRFRAQAGRP
jgi:hypothetical protein